MGGIARSTTKRAQTAHPANNELPEAARVFVRALEELLLENPLWLAGSFCRKAGRQAEGQEKELKKNRNELGANTGHANLGAEGAELSAPYENS